MGKITANRARVVYKIVITALTAFLAFLPLWLCLWTLEIWRESFKTGHLAMALILPISFVVFWLYAAYRFWQK